MIVIKALILVANDNAQRAKEAAFATLNSGVFASDNPIVDFALGFEQVLPIHLDDYADGDFVAHVPGGTLLETANNVSMPI
jgi:hypothetical protein